MTVDIKKLRELCEKAYAPMSGVIGIYRLAEALPEALDEIERLRKENILLREGELAIKHSVVDTVGGVSYEGTPTNVSNYLQRLRILVDKEKKYEQIRKIIAGEVE